MLAVGIPTLICKGFLRTITSQPQHHPQMMSGAAIDEPAPLHTGGL